jgi:hypothetical protein
MSNGWRDLWWCRQSLGPPSGRGILESQNVLQDIVGNLAFPSLGQYIYVSFHHRAMWSVARWRWYFDSQVDVELAALYLDYLSSLICWKGDLHVSWCQTSCGCSLPMNQNWIQHEERVNPVWLYHSWNGTLYGCTIVGMELMDNRPRASPYCSVNSWVLFLNKGRHEVYCPIK